MHITHNSSLHRFTRWLSASQQSV